LQLLQSPRLLVRVHEMNDLLGHTLQFQRARRITYSAIWKATRFLVRFRERELAPKLIAQ
jgi:hypothetical protein